MAYGVGVAYHISGRNFYSQVTQSWHILSINIVVVQSQTVFGMFKDCNLSHVHVVLS